MRIILFLIFLVLFTINYFMGGPGGIPGNFTVKLISYFNFLLFFSSVISVLWYFWPGDRNRTIFQLFNLIFIVVFYCVSFTFLLQHKDYYDGYAYLSDFACISRFALRWDIFSIMFWFIMVAFLINILYIVRYRSGTPAYQ